MARRSTRRGAEVQAQTPPSELVQLDLVAELQAAQRELMDATEDLTQTAADAVSHAHMAALVLERRRVGDQATRLRIAVARMGRAVGRAVEG
jgi:hypothetical protein